MTQQPTALIADDEPHLARFLTEQLTQLWPELRIVGQARNGVEAARMIADLQPDLAFLDIRMPGLSGLEVAQGIEGATQVVFVTAYDQFAVEAFERAALDYLLKPVSDARLRQTLARVQASLNQGTATDDARMAQALNQLQGSTATPAERLRWIRASAGETTFQVPVADVVFFEADEKYTVVHTALRQHLIRTPIAELAARLDPDQFWQVHRATLINLDWLESSRRDDASRLWLKLRGVARELPVSRAYVHLFKAM